MVMKYLDDLSGNEIAEALGKSPANVRVIIHRATKALTESIKNEQERTTTDSSKS